MPTFSKQIRKFDCVIEALPPKGVEGLRLDDYEALTVALKDFAQTLPCFYWAIIHDNDVDEDSGELKRPHIHLVVESQTRHTTLGVVRAIADGFGINQNRVSVRECRNLKLAIRYLLHMDDLDKAVYNPFDIVHNEQETLSQAMLSGSEDLTIEDLEKAIRACRNNKELAYRIGLKNFQRYRATINDIAPIIKEEQQREIAAYALQREGEKCVQANYRKDKENRE